MNKVDPELDFLIIEALDSNYKSIDEIASYLELDASLIENTLDELIEQGLAIEKMGNAYRVLFAEFND